MSIIHLYAQSLWHDDAWIGGTRQALQELGLAITLALARSEGARQLGKPDVSAHAEMQTFASDGEGYDLHVVVLSDADAVRMLVPYTDDCASEKRPWRDLFGPWNAIPKEAAEGAHETALAAAPSATATGLLDRPLAYLYHDAASAQVANPLVNSTMLVFAGDRRPQLRNETPLYGPQALAERDAEIERLRARVRELERAGPGAAAT